MRRVQFVFREITSARSKIRAGIAQHIDQLKRHAVTLAERQHLVFAQPREILNMPETESRPKFTDTTSNQISVLIQIGSCPERADFLRIIETLQIEHLAVSDFLVHAANVVSIGLLDLTEPTKTIRQRLEQLPFARFLL